MRGSPQRSRRVFLVIVGILGARLGTEFLPKLEEGNLWIRAVMPPTINLEAGMETVAGIRRTILQFAPVQTVASEQGRGDEGTDPDGSFLAEFFVPLKPHSEWPKGLTKDELVRQMNARLSNEFVGIDFNFSQYIQDNIEEAVSGVKGENSIKLFGRDLGELERLSKQIKSELGKVPGVVNPAAFNLLGQPNLTVRIDRAKAARYGFSVGDINTVVQAAIGGQEVTRVYEGEINSALTVRLAPRYRDNIDAIRSIPIALPSADPKAATAYIALSDVAEVKLDSGAAYIYRENSQRFIPLKYSVRERDLGSTVADAQERIARTVPLPQGYRMEWSGEFGALQEAKKRLGGDRAAQPVADPRAALQPVQLGARQPDRAVRHSLCRRRRHSRALCSGAARQRVGRGRLHLAVRRRRHGRHPARLPHPPRHGGGDGH